jgi:hypothetical protein
MCQYFVELYVMAGKVGGQSEFLSSHRLYGIIDMDALLFDTSMSVPHFDSRTA